jgi:hypothetical protein
MSHSEIAQKTGEPLGTIKKDSQWLDCSAEGVQG